MLPIVYSHLAIDISGADFTARVTFCGRILVEDDEEIILYGVEPGGAGSQGPNFETAWIGYRRELTLLLEQYASQADSLEAFETSVRALFASASGRIWELWNDAVASVQRNECETFGLPQVSDFQSSVRIERVDLDNLFREREQSVQVRAFAA